ncbi:transglycosylase SLT domain-containing protein [Nocardioides daejeonensis]|uniref:transglycosylase SLT domain-containing protein n=1 Tax=Nocardioides daejeonensis TaxID=1046556 RepID=UPI000D74274D|nr:transglycosylase SLT domain-containing protein [Nocardioides daejeonensis]
MSVADVTSRIQQIQAQFLQLRSLEAQFRSTGATTATTFADTLADVSATDEGVATGDQVVAEARKYLGLPYVWGGTDPAKGLDCSGLVQLVYKSLGYDLPRVSADQARAGRPVASMAEAQPGDLLAWDNSSRNNGADHIAIYIGGGKMIEAPRTGLNVRIVDVPSTPDMIRRILPEGSAAPVSASRGRVAADVPFADLFNAAGAKYGVDPGLLAAVAKQESGYNPSAVSSAGAQGLMQLMPSTAAGLGVRDSFNPTQAVDGAAKLLSQLLERFDSTKLALAAYNAGPGAVIRYDGIPPYRETQNYVASVMALWGGRS